MELPYAAEGIILASDKYREKDRMLTIYTKEFGKIRVISRGSRKMDSKLSPHLEPLGWINLMLVNGKSITTLTGSAQIKNFSNLKNKGVYTLLALHLAELVDKATLENLSDEKIFKLILDLLEYLNRNGEENPAGSVRQPVKLKIQEIILVFKLKLLEILGLRPAEINVMPEVLKILELDFFSSGQIDWKKVPKRKLEKIFDYAFFDVLGKAMVAFEKYIK
jgi:DNA repair protein RecO (recombination protein O)